MPTRTPYDVHAEFAALGLTATTTPEWRQWRWMALVGDRVAWLVEDADGAVRLAREKALLERLSTRVTFGVPEVVQAGPRWLVRERIPGISGFAVETVIFGRDEKVPAAERYLDEFTPTRAGARLAADLGRAIAELQRALSVPEAHSLGVADTRYTDLLDAVAVRLERHSHLVDLSAATHSLRSWVSTLDDNQALACRDLQMHNIAIDPTTGALNGVFDFEDAGIAHRLEDFKYLPSNGTLFADLALQASALPLSLDDIGRFHVISALEHFLFVEDTASRFAHIVEWTRAACARFL